ncbi:uncharacterized protein LOC116348268 [Contarinia nasturtii]|uniref:uncharacterized protein LOC116348268 n=1 Tax=Contarinia nasturtii TaxID=265458 RepID=UPI0012D45C49|nr:uncharacterized protein LOC116348268 [Contarinia nasturtii]
MKQFLFFTILSFLAFNDVCIKGATANNIYQSIVFKFALQASAIDWYPKIEAVFSLAPDFSDQATEILNNVLRISGNQEINTLCNELLSIPADIDQIPNDVQSVFNNWTFVLSATEGYVNANLKTITNFHQKYETGFIKHINLVKKSRSPSAILNYLKAAKKFVNDYQKRRNIWANGLMGASLHF